MKAILIQKISEKPVAHGNTYIEESDFDTKDFRKARCTRQYLY